MLQDITRPDMGEAILVTVFSMLIVFVTLLVISFILDGFRLAFYKEKEKKSKRPGPSSNKVTEPKIVHNPTGDDHESEELVAVIAAAIAATLSKSVTDIKIRKIRRVHQPTSSWAEAGRQEQIHTRL